MFKAQQVLYMVKCWLPSHWGQNDQVKNAMEREDAWMDLNGLMGTVHTRYAYADLGRLEHCDKLNFGRAKTSA